MSTSWNEHCPVCGSTAAPHTGPYACAACGFAYAHAAQFSGPHAVQAWSKAAQEARADLHKRMIRLCADRPVFQLSGGRIVFTSPLNGQVSIIGANNVQPQPANIRQYSTDENTRNEVFLYNDGHVTAKGDNEYGQCNTSTLNQIRRVLATARGTYALTENGTLERCGQTFPCNARNIRTLCASDNYLSVLTQDGCVQSSAVPPEAVQGWVGIKDIACTENAVLALREDGRVLFAGKQPDDPRAQAQRWHSIAAIGIEKNYAVGLTDDGQVLLAGKELNDFLDRGRKHAAEWTDMAAIACTSMGIAGLAADGTVRLVGNIRDMERLRHCWDQSFAASAHTQLLQALHPAAETPKSFL